MNSRPPTHQTLFLHLGAAIHHALSSAEESREVSKENCPSVVVTTGYLSGIGPGDDRLKKPLAQTQVIDQPAAANDNTTTTSGGDSGVPLKSPVGSPRNCQDKVDQDNKSVRSRSFVKPLYRRVSKSRGISVTTSLVMEMEDTEDSSLSESEWIEVPFDNELYEKEYFRRTLFAETSTDEKNDTLPDTATASSSTDANTPSTSQGLQVVIPQDGIKGKLKKNIVDCMVVREVNKSKRDIFLSLHRTSLLCHLAIGRMYNSILRCPEIFGSALSLLPSERAYPPKHLDLTYVERFLTWFSRTITLDQDSQDHGPAPDTLQKELLDQMATKVASTNDHRVFIFISILRALGVQVRLIVNVQPLPLKPPSSELMKFPKEEDADAGSKLTPKSPQPHCSKSSTKRLKLSDETTTEIDLSSSDSNSEVEVTDHAYPKKRKYTKKGQPMTKSASKAEVSELVTRKKRKYTKRSQAMDKSASMADVSEPVKREKRKYTKRSQAMDKSDSKPVEKDALPKAGTSSCAKSEAKTAESTKKPKPGPQLKKPCNMWAEVFLEEEQQWISIDVAECKLMSEDTIKAKASKPICYVVAYSNTGHVKDVTMRYNDGWWSEVGKLRDDDWWNAAIRPFRGKKTLHDKREDETLVRRLDKVELPKTISAFKNHPKFALKRHLLKFEAIYPEDVMPLGTIKSELVYPRSSVYTLFGREQWLRKGRVVRIGEKPYKIVEGRKYKGRVCGTADDREPLIDLFGHWQTEEYEPPIAVDGKVPKNAYGNVELFVPKMLPVGTVHLQLDGLGRIARKLNLDCAQALVGFDYRPTGGCYPRFDGYVVCEEFKDIFIDAWNQEQSITMTRGEEKRLSRVKRRWIKIFRLVRIRNRLKKKYGYSLGDI